MFAQYILRKKCQAASSILLHRTQGKEEKSGEKKLSEGMRLQRRQTKKKLDKSSIGEEMKETKQIIDFFFFCRAERNAKLHSDNKNIPGLLFSPLKKKSSFRSCIESSRPVSCLVTLTNGHSTKSDVERRRRGLLFIGIGTKIDVHIYAFSGNNTHKETKRKTVSY